MFDLIGYWTGITLFVYIISFLVVLVTFKLVVVVCDWSSRGRVDIGHKATKLFNKIYLIKEDEFTFGVVAMCVSFVFWGFYLCYVFAALCGGDYGNIISLVGVANFCILPLTPILGYVGVICAVVCVCALLSRKLFDAYFLVKDKIDAIGRKVK